MKIKVCGLKFPENIEAVLSLPVEFIGLIFYPKSPRFAESPALEKWLNKHASKFEQVSKVGVFVNAEIEQVLNAVHDYQLDFVQLHGNESPEYCQELKQYWDISSLRHAKIIKAFGVDEHFDFAETQAYARWCAYFLFDTPGPQHGGSGVVFDWSLLQNYEGVTPFFLSGGIDEDSAKAIRKLKLPSLVGIDLNSRFETEPGVKDVEKIKRFLEGLAG